MPTSMSVAPGLDHLRRDEAGPADGGNQNVGLPRDRRQVARLRVANRNGGVLVEQQHRDGLAHNVAAAHDHGVLAGDGNLAALENLNHAGRRAGRKRRAAGKQAARVHGMKAVHIFGWIDGVEQRLWQSTCGGRGSWIRMPSMSSRALRLGDQREHLFCGHGRRAA